jgi:capsular exopolysaccharide synthesis family protein
VRCCCRRSGRGATDLSTQGQLFLQNVSANDQKLSEVNTQLSVLDQLENFVKNNSNSNGIVPTTLGVGDPMLSQLVEKLYTSELEYEKLRKTVGENNPSMVALRDQISKIKPNILQNIQSQKRSLNATKNNISSTNSSYNSMLQAVPQKERQLLEISREHQIISDVYSFLLQKREESEIAYESAVANNRVVDYAQAGGQVGPKSVLIYAFFIILFLGVCLALITIKESFTGKILYRKEIEKRTRIPIISEIAFDKSKKAIVIESGKRSFVAEEFRKLRLSLSYLGIGQNHKKILVTSSIPGEGKSFIATNLAISLSLTGKRVVLVDMDLNNPTIHKKLNLEREEGVADFLKGEKNELEIIRPTEYEGLFFISAGSLPDDPTELLANGKVKELIDYLSSVFDSVVLDTSPMVPVTDGYLLTTLCDATLFVIRHNYTPKIVIKRLDINGQINPIYNPAIIFNGVKQRGFFRNNYGYGYDYVYGGKYAKRS